MRRSATASPLLRVTSVIARPLAPEQLAEYADLAAEQGRLAAILEDLIQSAEEAAAAAEQPDGGPSELDSDLEKSLNDLDGADPTKPDLDAELLKDLEEKP